jgi:hypothetical protein
MYGDSKRIYGFQQLQAFLFDLEIRICCAWNSYINRAIGL